MTEDGKTEQEEREAQGRAAGWFLLLAIGSVVVAALVLAGAF